MSPGIEDMALAPKGLVRLQAISLFGLGLCALHVCLSVDASLERKQWMEGILVAADVGMHLGFCSISGDFKLCTIFSSTLQMLKHL